MEWDFHGDPPFRINDNTDLRIDITMLPLPPTLPSKIEIYDRTYSKIQSLNMYNCSFGITGLTRRSIQDSRQDDVNDHDTYKRHFYHHPRPAVMF